MQDPGTRREGRLSRRVLVIGAGAAAAIATGGRALGQATPATPLATSGEPIKVAFVYIGPVGDVGWTYAHDQGRLRLEENIPSAETTFIENVPENQADAERALRGFAEAGNDVIVATSFGYGPSVLSVAAQYPGIQFIHISGYQTAENVSTAFGKIEEPRYVSGFVAGKMSASGKLGYVAAFPIPEVIRGINAFTRGVLLANPEATVQVVWTNTWYDPSIERSAAEALLDGGADVIAQHQDTPAPQQAAEAAGKYGVGYNVDMSAQAPTANLTNPVWNWGVYYTQAVQQIQAGSWASNQYWGSWQDGVVDLSPIAGFVPADIQSEATALADEFRSGAQGITSIFSGPLLDQDGTERVAAGASMTGEEILVMDWFVQGVLGEPSS